jgi:hypothetical protein
MTSLTILTANVGYGFAGMDRLVPSLKHQLHIHGWEVLAYLFCPSPFRKSGQISRSKRVAYVLKNKNLSSTEEMISRTQPDVLVLNELIYEVYGAEVEAYLRRQGFQTIGWGISSHYPGTTISTLVAVKAGGELISCSMPQRPSLGGGAGMAGIRLAGQSIFGVHLTYRSPALFVQQIRYIAKMAADERARGNEVVIAGDWNESASIINANSDFRSLSLMPGASREHLTCPTFFPSFLQNSLDHVFIPDNWQQVSSQTIPFGSDHLALAVEVRPIRIPNEDGR